MYGAMIGDYVGSIYEWHNIKTKDFPLFQDRCFLTDDSFMTIAVAQACSNWPEHRDLVAFARDVSFEMQRIGNIYPHKGYGGGFRKWLRARHPRPYNSCGNGSAMRVSPCGFVAGSLQEAELLAEASAAPTHNHPEGIKGAKAVAGAIYLAKSGYSKEEIRDYITTYYYPLDRTLDEIRPEYTFQGTCQGTVPESIQAFLESTGFEDAIRNAISLGGDSDTLAAITGSIAEAYYGVPQELRDHIKRIIYYSCELEERDIVSRFRKFMAPDEAPIPDLSAEPVKFWRLLSDVEAKRFARTYRMYLDHQDADPSFSRQLGPSEYSARIDMAFHQMDKLLRDPTHGPLTLEERHLALRNYCELYHIMRDLQKALNKAGRPVSWRDMHGVHPTRDFWFWLGKYSAKIETLLFTDVLPASYRSQSDEKEDQ